MAVCVPQRVSGHGTYTFVPMLSGVLEVSLRVVMVKLRTPYLAFRGVALAEVSA